MALCTLIQRLVVDHLHIVGDIFDRGPGAAQIMDILMNYHSVDIQWGNHDVLWMGAAAGQLACIANVIRISAKYGNLDTIEDDYGINLIPLATLALHTYRDDPCSCFKISIGPTSPMCEIWSLTGSCTRPSPSSSSSWRADYQGAAGVRHGEPSAAG